MGGEHGHRRPFANCTMRSHIVVVLAPKFDLCAGVVKIHEPVLVQAFKANTSVEAFDEGIVSGFARSAEVHDDTIRIGHRSNSREVNWLPLSTLMLRGLPNAATA